MRVSNPPVNRDVMLENLLRKCGSYYHRADLFYQELWKQRLIHMGFRVISVEKLDLHDVWDIRLRGSLTAQAYLLVSKPISKQVSGHSDLMARQLRTEIRSIAADLGCPIRADCIQVVRTGALLRASFIWPVGRPGLLLKARKKPEAFSFLIRPWLRKRRN